jgi:transposase
MEYQRDEHRVDHLSKRIMDAGWEYFRQRLEAKAAEAGRILRVGRTLWAATYPVADCVAQDAAGL